MIEARPCKCGALPRERIGDGFPMAICGISMGAPFGTYLYCPFCGERTNSFREPLEAYNAWNRKMDYLTDPTGTPLTPSFHGKDCLGNGEHPGIECCCDECDHYLTCFPDYDQQASL